MSERPLTPVDERTGGPPNVRREGAGEGVGAAAVRGFGVGGAGIVGIVGSQVSAI